MIADVDRVVRDIEAAGKVAGRLVLKVRDDDELLAEMHELISHLGLALNAARREQRRASGGAKR